MKASSGYADVVDRLLILDLKVAHLDHPAARAERAALLEDWATTGLPPVAALPGVAELAATHAALWGLEDEIRRLDAANDVGERFIAVSREIRRRNDDRARLKRQLNRLLGSPFEEVKSHAGASDP